eukprot:TRINITY_DN3494_c0_g1_i1.p1 TRINITY_DN3494_c0_g1~~TRINITY_DN3494_c0_g1_i1.p1  ORF type:complete len:463 (+),score=62.27 TRINITY_DN3494_c0_g1_i1:35-1423(+)
MMLTLLLTAAVAQETLDTGYPTDDVIRGLLAAINEHRAYHGDCQGLVWDQSIADTVEGELIVGTQCKASALKDELPYGLWMLTGGNETRPLVEVSVPYWYNHGYGSLFELMVWASATSIGCALCRNGDGVGGYMLTMYCKLSDITGTSADNVRPGGNVCPTPSPTTPAPALPQPYPLGCFDTTTRFLTNRIYADAANTPSRCVSECTAAGYSFAGVEAGLECWCGHSILDSTKIHPSLCATPCTGDSALSCGGYRRMELYRIGAPGPSQPTPSAVGCYEVDPSSRALHERVYKGAGNTVGECASVCWWNGYKYAGLEAGDECWCGTVLPVRRLVSSKCALPCSGNSSEHCGNGYRTSVWAVDGSVWSPPAHTYSGCYADRTTGRVLPVLAFWDDACTVEECVSVCADRGFQIAGLQFRSQCWCGNSITATKVKDSLCRLPCKGDNSEVCGYAWRHSVYEITL